MREMNWKINGKEEELMILKDDFNERIATVGDGYMVEEEENTNTRIMY